MKLVTVRRLHIYTIRDEFVALVDIKDDEGPDPEAPIEIKLRWRIKDAPHSLKMMMKKQIIEELE